jgi:hypothetical protein
VAHPSSFFNKPSTNNQESSMKTKSPFYDFRSGTGQFCDSNENKYTKNIKSNWMMECEEQKIRPGNGNWFKNDYHLDEIIKQQEEMLTKDSNVPKNFNLVYMEFDQLPHISQYQPSVSEYLLNK